MADSGAEIGNLTDMEQRARLATLKTEHRALDDWIAALMEAPFVDQLEIRRLKKRKLALRDEIARLEDLITPDIIA